MPVRLVGRFSESLSAVFATKLRSGSTGNICPPLAPNLSFIANAAEGDSVKRPAKRTGN